MLYHAIYPFFWYTELDGTMEIAGNSFLEDREYFLHS